MSATGKSDSISKTSLKLLNGCWKKIELINSQVKLFLNILLMTQLLKWCFWISLLEQFKNKKQLIVVLKKTAITLILSNNFNDSRREKLYFIPFSTIIFRNRCLAAPDLCHIFTQSIELFTFHCHILISAYFLIRSLMKSTEKEWLLFSVTFTAKLNGFFT